MRAVALVVVSKVVPMAAVAFDLPRAAAGDVETGVMRLFQLA